VTVEIDPERVAQARERLADTPAEVLEGDWRELLPPRAPFDAIFADGGAAYDEVAGLLAPGGILVKDDLTPGRAIDGDQTREALMLDQRLEARVFDARRFKVLDAITDIDLADPDLMAEAGLPLSSEESGAFRDFSAAGIKRRHDVGYKLAQLKLRELFETHGLLSTSH